jgi:hypothetical protein
MQYFIIRPFQDTHEVHLHDNITLYKLSINLFKQFEPNFNLPINIKQLDYYKNTFHQIIHYNGTVETFDLSIEEYNIYISKIATYQQLEKAIKDEEAGALLPQTLLAAKLQVEKAIYIYASQLQEQRVNLYCAAERDRWTTIILPEAQAYVVSQESTDAPNLTAQHTIRTGISNPNLPEFKAGLLAVVNQILQSNEYLVNYANFVAGTRAKWLDVVRAFEQTQMETEKEAITRLLALDWKQGWEMPAN